MSHVSHISSRRLRGVVSAVLVLGAGLALAACSEGQTARAPEVVRPVKVVKVEESAPTSRIVLSGSVKARTEAGLGFRVPGKIVERLVNVGDHVEPGEVLARLDTNDLDLALRNAEAAVGSAKSRLDVAEKALGRYKALLAKGFIAQSVLDQRQLEFDQASGALDSAISTRDQARNQADYSELKADAAGIVTEIRAEVGQVVNAGAPVVVVARDGDKEVAIAVPENEIRHFAVGDTARGALLGRRRDRPHRHRARSVGQRRPDVADVRGAGQPAGGPARPSRHDGDALRRRAGQRRRDRRAARRARRA